MSEIETSWVYAYTVYVVSEVCVYDACGALVGTTKSQGIEEEEEYFA